MKDLEPNSLVSRREFLGVVGVAGLFIAACLPMPDAPPVSAVHPTPKSVSVRSPIEPYLTLPFRRKDNNGQYQIIEGWFYSQEEQDIHGFKNHFAIDLHVSHGTPVVAPVDCLVMSSYHAIWLRNPDGTFRLWQGKEVGFGLGYFVQGYIPPPVDTFFQIGHLSEIDQSIPFSLPVYDAESDHWNSTNHTLTSEELTKHPMVTSVKRGDPLGKVGFSGLRWGRYQEYRAGEQRPVPIDPNIQKSWDEPHVHFENYLKRDPQSLLKVGHRDPYGIHSTAEHYPQPGRLTPMGQEVLWILDAEGLPAFAV